MVSLLKQLGLVTGGACLALALPLAARAQFIQPGFRVQGPIGLNQAAFNQAMTGQVHPGISPVSSFPYGNPLFNPIANPIANPFANPALNPALNPSALANYFNPGLAFQSNPLINPYTSPFTSPYAAAALSAAYTNPYAGAANPYAGYANPYLAASLTSSGYGGSGYGGYGDTGGYGSPYAGYGESPIGGYMRGTADIVGAQGRWMKDLQQASLTKEQVRQAKIDTRRKYFDEYYYERKNTPTFEQEREFFNNQQLLRSLNNPPESEIWSGQALNDILADVAKMDKDKTARGPSIPLDEDVLRHINLNAGPGAGNAGLLKNDARLTWPLALRDESYKTDRELVNTLAPEAVHQAINGRVDAGTLRELTSAALRLRQNLTANIRDMTANQYTDASRFLGYLDDAVRALGRPDAGDYFTRKYAAQGKDVAELVRNLNAKGLRFAPATPGDEPAYLAVHRALAVYDRGAKAELASEARPGDAKP
jgi:hypothetical protein